MLKFIINGQTLERADEEPPIRGTVGLKAAFLFRGNVWTEAKSVVVRYDVGGGTTYEVLLDVPDNGYVESFVPWEALKKSRFTVACIAGSDTPTNGVAVVTAASGFRGEESPAPPSDTVYQQQRPRAPVTRQTYSNRPKRSERRQTKRSKPPSQP